MRGSQLPTLTLSRSDVTVDEVSAVLSRALGSRNKVTRSISVVSSGDAPSSEASTILVTSNWIAKANIRIAHRGSGTEIQVTRGAVFGLVGLFLGSGLVRKVSRALELAPELNKTAL
jgi:hypothetical protein